MKETRNITEVVLATVFAAGVISMAILAPNAIQALQFFGIGKKRRKKQDYIRQKRVISSTISRLKRNGLVQTEQRDDGTIEVFLTSQGERRLAAYRLKKWELPDPRSWDGKWRLILFDIKERKRSRRDWLRLELRSLGFVKLQHSVWVLPYECEDLISLIKIDGHFGRDVICMVGESIEHDASLRKHFHLPSAL